MRDGCAMQDAASYRVTNLVEPVEPAAERRESVFERAIRRGRPRCSGQAFAPYMNARERHAQQIASPRTTLKIWSTCTTWRR